MSLTMPALDQVVLARRDRIVAGCRAIVPGEGVIAAERGNAPLRIRWADRLPRAAHGGRAARNHGAGEPGAALLPRRGRQGGAARGGHLALGWRLAAVRRRSPGAWPSSIESARSTRELGRRGQPGVTNLAVTQAVEHAGFYYAPDPSSQIACTIGGNVAENSGGVHCLKYGMTTNNLLAAARADHR